MIRRAVVQLIFWGWNLLFALTVGLSMPSIAWSLLRAAWDGEVPGDLAGTALALLLAPFLSVLAWIGLRGRAGATFRLLFGIELPLCVLLCLRLFLVRELTPGTAHVFAVGALGLAAFTADVVRRSTRPLPAIALVPAAGLLVSAGWAAALGSFFILPAFQALGHVASELARELLRPGYGFWSGEYGVRATPQRWLTFAATGGFVVATVGLLALAPVGGVIAYVGTWWRLTRATARASGVGAVVAATTVGLGVLIAPAFLVRTQPQVEALARLEQPPADDAARIALLADSGRLRAGLLNAYLAPQRYLTSTHTSRAIAELYAPYGVGEPAQAVFNWLLAPFIYEGASQTAARDRAAQLYADLFDTPIQRAEAPAILRSLASTWDRDGVEAGLLDVSGEKVLLAEQHVTIERVGDLATVQVDERYVNHTTDQQEVYYYFSLPTSAAVTGLWLSDDPADPTRFVGVLAPRGAAQQVYQEQRREWRDPALLEQVGPRQYRLRAFPVLPRPSRGEDGPPLCVRFTYTTPIDAQGVPLPALHERRNIYWDVSTRRTGVEDPGDTWFTPHVGPGATPTGHTSRLPDGSVVEAVPAQARPFPGVGHRYAVVLDRSRSMADHAAEVGTSLAWLRREVARTSTVELHVTAGWGAGAPTAASLDTFDAATTLWFGALPPHALLDQHHTLATGTYDAVLVLTDAGSYDLSGTDAPPLPPVAGPLWMVHLGGALAPAYDDSVLHAIQASHGGVATSIAEAFTRLPEPDVVDGYYWRVRPPDASAAAEDAVFAPLAARWWVGHTTRTRDLQELGELDTVHAVARAAGVVTPYSSLIALVDAAQRERLSQLEADKDRFEREAEAGVEQLPAPSDAFAVTAVPEPDEWALLLLAAVLLLAVRRRAQLARR